MTTEISIFTEQGFATTFKIAEAMVKSGILPRGIDNPYKAFAIIQKGREMGVEPMRALTGIYLIEGKTVVSPELKLECFRARGGKVQWVESTGTVAHVKLTSADGTSHDETVTMQEMTSAGLAGKDNWRKYPKSMLRARCIAFALRAMGEGDGSYTPDELGAETTEAGEYIPPPVRESASRIAGVHTLKGDVTGRSDDAGQRHTMTVEAPQDAGKETTARSASATTDSATAPASNGTWKPGRAGTAAAVAPTGGPITPDQIKAIHTLLSRVGNITDEAYRKQVAVYRQADGTPCADADGKGTSKLLSREQASHLISRLEAKCDRQEQRAGAGVDLDAAVPSRPATPPLADLLQTRFTQDDEEGDWLHSLFGVRHAKELDATEQDTALQLLLVLGTDAYDNTVEKARALGRIR